jgi:hypothetical protein
MVTFALEPDDGPSLPARGRALTNGIRLIGGSQRTPPTINGDLAVWHYLPRIGDAIAGVGGLVVALLSLSRGRVPRVRRFAWSGNHFGAIALLIAMPINVIFRLE